MESRLIFPWLGHFVELYKYIVIIKANIKIFYLLYWFLINIIKNRFMKLQENNKHPVKI